MSVGSPHPAQQGGVRLHGALDGDAVLGHECIISDGFGTAGPGGGLPLECTEELSGRCLTPELGWWVHPKVALSGKHPLKSTLEP